MARIVWTEPAVADLDRIADFIALDKPCAARSFVKQVFHRIEQLESNPQSGSIPTELKGIQYRQLIIPPIRIFYRQEEDLIYIILNP